MLYMLYLIVTEHLLSSILEQNIRLKFRKSLQWKQVSFVLWLDGFVLISLQKDLLH